MSTILKRHSSRLYCRPKDTFLIESNQIRLEPAPSKLASSKLATWQLAPWTARPMDSSPLGQIAHGQLAPWTVRPMDSLPHGQLAPWTASPMDSSPHGQFAPWATPPMDSSAHRQFAPWTACPMDNLPHGGLLGYANDSTSEACTKHTTYVHCPKKILNSFLIFFIYQCLKTVRLWWFKNIHFLKLLLLYMKPTYFPFYVEACTVINS
jgi:hypothetical protein